MNEIIITVVGIEPPQPGKKKGIITDHTGKKWGVWPELLQTIVPNQTYKVNRYDTNQYMGRTYFTIKDLIMITNVGSSGPPQNYSNRTTGGPAPSPAPMSLNRPAGNDDGQRRLDIFVCGAFNNYLANPNVNPSSIPLMELVDTLHKFRSAWLAVFGPSPLPRRRPDDPITSGPQGSGDLNDTPPF